MDSLRSGTKCLGTPRPAAPCFLHAHRIIRLFPGLTRSARVHGTRINTAGWQTLKQSLSRTFFISSHYGLRVLSFKKNKRERERGKWDNVYTDTYKTVHPLNGKTMPGLSGSGSMGIRAEQIKAKDTETKAQCPHLSRTRAHFPAMPRS